MSNPKCPVCGQINRAGAAVCEMCDSRLDGAAPPPAEEFRGPAEEPRPGALPTDIPSPHFKGAGDVISPTLEVYRKNFVLIGILVFVTTLPVVLLQYFGVQAMAAAADAGPAGASNMISVGLISQVVAGLLSLVGTALLSGALVYAVIELQRTGRAGAAASLRYGLKVLPKVFIVTLLYAIITGVGYILLIVPGVIFSLMYAVATPAAVAENLGPWEAMKRSDKLTEGYKGLIFLTYFLWTLLIIVLNMIVAGSFGFSGAGDTLTTLVIVSLVSGMLQASTTVLTVYIYLGLLNEARETFNTHAFTPAPEAAGR